MRPEIRAHGGPLLRVKTRDLQAAGVERVFERTAGVEDGRPVLDAFQYSFGSLLFIGVEQDSKHVAKRILTRSVNGDRLTEATAGARVLDT